MYQWHGCIFQKECCPKMNEILVGFPVCGRRFDTSSSPFLYMFKFIIDTKYIDIHFKKKKSEHAFHPGIYLCTHR